MASQEKIRRGVPRITNFDFLTPEKQGFGVTPLIDLSEVVMSTNDGPRKFGGTERGRKLNVSHPGKSEKLLEQESSNFFPCEFF